MVLWWAITSAVAVGAMTPLMLFAHGQSFQVAWIYPLNWHSVLDVVQHQYFDNSVPFAILAGGHFRCRAGDSAEGSMGIGSAIPAGC